MEQRHFFDLLATVVLRSFGGIVLQSLEDQ
jgi:hypothetical protein